ARAARDPRRRDRGDGVRRRARNPRRARCARADAVPAPRPSDRGLARGSDAGDRLRGTRAEPDVPRPGRGRTALESARRPGRLGEGRRRPGADGLCAVGGSGGRRRPPRDRDAGARTRGKRPQGIPPLLARSRPVLGADPPSLAEGRRVHLMPVLALVLVTAVWGVTFVQVKDAVALYPLFAFLALRFAIASLALLPPAWPRLRSLGTRGTLQAAGLGLLLAAGYALQTGGLERTTVSGTGFITGMSVVLTPLLAVVLVRASVGAWAWAGVLLATAGLAMLTGIQAGSAAGDLLVLGAAAVYSVQIVLMERYAPLHDPLAFTLVEMAAAALGLLVVAVVHGDLGVPRGWTVWGALLVTGVFASALAFLLQTWAQRRTSATRTALAFTMEPAWAALLGYPLAGVR